MALTDKYDIPYLQRGFCNKDPRNSGYSLVEPFMLRHGAVESLWIEVASPYVKLQLEWAWRWRYKPSYVESDPSLDEMQTEVWETTDWEHWKWYNPNAGDQYRVTTVKTSDPFALSRAFKVATITTDPLLSADLYFDTSKYDRVQFAFRMRANGTENGQPLESEWNEVWICADPVPYADRIGYRSKGNGFIHLELESQNERPFNTTLFDYWVLPVGSSTWEKVNSRKSPVWFDGEYDGLIPATIYQGGTGLPYCPCEQIGFSLGGGAQPSMMIDTSYQNPDYAGRLYYPEDDPEHPMWIIDPALNYEQSLAAPVLSYSVSDGKLTVTATEDGSAFTDVDAALSWTGPLGDVHFYDAQMMGVSGVWTAVFDYPPFDVDVDVALMFKDGTDYNLCAETTNVQGDGRCWFSYGDESVKLNLDVSLSHQYTPEGETVKLAGRSNPVARYGVGGVREISLTGVLVSLGGDWLTDFERLNEGHDWVFRAPNGEWRLVKIESVSRSADIGLSGKKWEVDISMTEVDHGGLE